jgi:hypothetical protein
MSLQRQAPKFLTYVDNELVNDLSVVSVSHSLGGDRADCAILAQEQAGVSRSWLRAQALSLRQLIFYGRMAAVNASLDAGGERLSFTARFDSHLLGARPRRREMTLDQSLESAGLTKPVEIESGFIHFNPVDDAGRLMPTMWRPLEAEPILIDVAAYPRDRAKWESNENLWFWTVPEAIHYLCQTWNYDQAHVDNPSPDDLAKLFLDPETGDIDLGLRDIRVDMAGTLGDALTRVLEPFGWAWYIDYLEPGKRRVWFRKRHDEDVHELQLQPWGERIDPDRSDIDSYNLAFDLVSRSCSSVRVLTERPLVEVSLTLVPGWLAAYDNMPYATLNAKDDAAEKDPARKRAWRTWVANETGEHYGELRKRGCSRPNETTTQLREAFARAVDTNGEGAGLIAQPELRRIRRKFAPMLTCDAEGRVKRCDIEYCLDVTSNSPNWQPISQLTGTPPNVRFLDDEIGIEFTNDPIPLPLIRNTDSNWINTFGIRCTACVEGDAPVAIVEGPETTEELTNQAFLRDEMPIVIDGAEQFHARMIDPRSRFYWEVRNGTLSSDVQVDDVAARNYAKSLRETWSAASCGGAITLWGLNVADDDILGRPVTITGGRDVDLNTQPDTSQRTSYPVVISIERDIDQQRTQLVLDSYRSPQ